MGASTAVLGPLLGRFGKATVAMPGGCNIGARKIDMHILGLQALGVDFDLDHGDINATTQHGLSGTTVTLDFASVGATENIMLAATAAGLARYMSASVEPMRPGKLRLVLVMQTSPWARMPSCAPKHAPQPGGSDQLCGFS